MASIDGFEFQGNDDFAYTYKNKDGIVIRIDVVYGTVAFSSPTEVHLSTLELLFRDAKRKYYHSSGTSLTYNNYGLTERTYNAIRRAGYQNLTDFVGVNFKDVMKIRNIGVKSYLDLERVLKEYSIVLDEDDVFRKV